VRIEKIGFMKNLFLLLFVLCPSCSVGEGQKLSPTEDWTFKSKFDQFSLKRLGEKGEVSGREISIMTLQDFLPVMDREPVDACPKLPGKPDLFVTRKGANRTTERSIFVAKKMATDGSKCIDVSGLGIYYAPFHRDWFTGPAEITLNLNNGFALSEGKRLLVHTVNSAGELKAKTPRVC